MTFLKTCEPKDDWVSRLTGGRYSLNQWRECVKSREGLSGFDKKCPFTVTSNGNIGVDISYLVRSEDFRRQVNKAIELVDRGVISMSQNRVKK